ncbi:MAG: hypothetical protein ABH950_05640 [Candidatus Altiarchaeota archaeon]
MVGFLDSIFGLLLVYGFFLSFGGFIAGSLGPKNWFVRVLLGVGVGIVSWLILAFGFSVLTFGEFLSFQKSTLFVSNILFIQLFLNLITSLSFYLVFFVGLSGLGGLFSGLSFLKKRRGESHLEKKFSRKLASKAIVTGFGTALFTTLFFHILILPIFIQPERSTYPEENEALSPKTLTSVCRGEVSQLSEEVKKEFAITRGYSNWTVYRCEENVYRLNSPDDWGAIVYFDSQGDVLAECSGAPLADAFKNYFSCSKMKKLECQGENLCKS